MIHTDLITPEMERAIAACGACYDACLRAATGEHLLAGRQHLAPEHFRLLLDCADVCALAERFLLRGSAFHERACAVCAEVSAACAQSCAQFADLAECAAPRRRCAERCRVAAGVE
jgi:hypothetical protein